MNTDNKILTMKGLYTFSPIESEEEMMEAISFIHFACFSLFKESFGEYFENAGNIGIFTQYESEYELLTNLAKDLTDTNDSIFSKYFKLKQPITIEREEDVPKTTYIYLYIRKPDPYRHQVGDLDFILDEIRYDNIKNRLNNGEKMKGTRMYDKPYIDMIELYNPDVDALGYIRTRTTEELNKIGKIGD